MKEQEKGKAKVQEEEVLQEEPEDKIPQPLPTQQEFNIAKLNSLLLVSTLMQTMRARGEESQQEDNAFKALEVVATTSLEKPSDLTWSSFIPLLELE